jgi:hypothetical protein
VEYTFVPPESGRYRFHTDSQYDAVLAVYHNDNELGCNDDFQSTASSQVDVDLEAGVGYTVVVDGYRENEGSFSLTVSRATDTQVAVDTPPNTPLGDTPGMAPRCASAPVLGAETVEGILDPSVRTAAVTCGSRGPGGDMVYRFDAPTAGTVTLQLTAGFDLILELRAGCARGHEVLGCNDDYGDTRHSRVQAHLQPGSYYIIVDSYSAQGQGAFALQAEFQPDTVAEVATDPSASPSPAGPPAPSSPTAPPDGAVTVAIPPPTAAPAGVRPGPRRVPAGPRPAVGAPAGRRP